MITLNTLSGIYKPNDPILIEDLKNRFDYSEVSVRKSMSLLAKVGGIKRFSRGLYYIPSETIFGESKLKPSKVINVKYLERDSNVIGIYTGLKLLNKLRLTTQVPNVVEVMTNVEKNRKREVILGKQKVILRSSRVKIDNRNVRTVEILEALRLLKSIDANQIKRIREYIQNDNISRRELDEVLINYPKSVFKKLVESGLINEFTS
ncbi:DUF6088 family protein [Petrocella sp. FN5]|uniref:DUF6088 family protein n=1 Tax=Petrocella sp. FN5 TaxID=3032002 RepID=UPI0023DA17EF|nr:DUF6088 family protein [Petrocella sp. FN5]MDF1618684.1 DUF6088 family protein [Petrocella sp. FN5]